MGADDETELIEVGHHVADAGRRQIQPGMFGQRARSHRLALGDIPFDQGFEQDARAFGEHGAIIEAEAIRGFGCEFGPISP